MSSTILRPPRAHLCIGYCSNKHNTTASTKFWPRTVRSDSDADADSDADDYAAGAASASDDSD
jgi:hypothetical protein